MIPQQKKTTSPARLAARSPRAAAEKTTASIIAPRRAARKPEPFVVWADVLKGVAHVQSTSDPDHYHECNAYTGACSCPARTRWGGKRCRHVVAARQVWGQAIVAELRVRDQRRRLATLRLQADYAGPLHFYAPEQEEGQLWAS